MGFNTHDDYFATVAPEVRTLLDEIQTEIERRIPDAICCIAYQMPSYRLAGPKGRVFFYFAAFKKHIGVYPPVHDPALVAELAPYSGPKGNLIFPLKDPLPIDLIGRVAEALARQYAR
jgi:uncharacterized protein YdhG (YjbR/CyaY superfamily)